ncbi:cytochrome c oxidase assembly protein COX16-domain-containing protein [Dichomitus squalens]|uniref:Cytochrome c oxidase assembly protein COX16, mitochondrial n=1 Tax=Dichomitus squalens TaxID=114155 RepID=A0A4Q9N466_9APHY|nr:cytochrome c oxidase assembly protein COX16-domain-containing protein [Dichomitus squalens]
MPAFPSNPLNEAAYSRLFRRYPALFGVPFVLLIVGASFGMQQFTQTRYDLHSQKVTALNKEQELGLQKNRKQFDIREEYFKLSSTAVEDWEPKRIQRPKGVPDWGVPPEEPPQKRS